MPFNLKGLLQDEEFLFAAGLLQQGSQGKSIGAAAFPSLVQAGKIKQAFTPTAKKTKQAYDNVLKKNVFVTDAEIAGMPTRFTPIDNSQVTSFNAETGEYYSGSLSGMKFKEKKQINNTETANKLKADYNILELNIKELQEKVTKTPTGAYGKVVSGFNIVADQFAQIKDFNVDSKFAKNSVLNKDLEDFLNSKGITKDAQNYAQVRSSITNLAYVLAKIAEPGNPKYSEGDIKRQFDRIAWGGSRDQIVAGLQQVLEDEWRTASIEFERLNPKGEWGFEDPRKKSTTNNKKIINNNQGGKIVNDILELEEFL